MTETLIGQLVRLDPITVDHAPLLLASVNTAEVWDSVAYMPEAALAGPAAGAFASNEVPTLAPLESSGAFLGAYQARRGRRFSTEDTEVAWAASLWTAVHNARADYRCGTPAVARSGPGAAVPGTSGPAGA